MELANPNIRRDAFGRTINRDHSALLAIGLPWFTILFGSISPMLPVIAAVPVIPPLGFLVMMAWRSLRPGLLPLWAGFPLGLFDDLFSGQPFGSGILLYSLSLIAYDLLELRFPWRGFWQNWLVASLFLTIFLLASALLAGADLGLLRIGFSLPQILLSVMLFPVVVSLVSLLDRLRLLRVRRIR
jgi:rod shape-determining protein MreD